MPVRSPVWRALTLLSFALVAFFGASAIVIAVRGDASTAQATGANQLGLALARSSAATTLPVPTVPPTTAPPAPPPAPAPEPVPEPDPEPAPPARDSSPPAARNVDPAPAPALVSTSCQSLSAGGLIAAHSGIKPYSGDGGLSANAQAFALTLCNAHAEGNLFHSGQAAGENLAWIYSSGGCMNDGVAVVGYWMNSPAHRANIERFSVVGGGVACDGNNTYFVAQYR